MVLLLSCQPQTSLPRKGNLGASCFLQKCPSASALLSRLHESRAPHSTKGFQIHLSRALAAHRGYITVQMPPSSRLHL